MEDPEFFPPTQSTPSQPPFIGSDEDPEYFEGSSQPQEPRPNPYPFPQIMNYGPAFQARPIAQPPNFQLGGGQQQLPPQGQQPAFMNPSDLMQAFFMNYGRHFGNNPFANLR